MRGLGCLAVAALALGGCALPAAKGPAPAPSPSSSPLPAPEGLVTPGQLTVASDLRYPPQESLGQDGKAAGFDIDLAGAIAAALGLRLEVVNIDTPSIVPGFAVQPRRYDMGISALPDTPGLGQTARTLDYFRAGLSILVRRGRASGIKGVNDLCGLRVGAERGSSAELAVMAQNERPCHDNRIDYHAYSFDTDAVKDLRASSLDAVLDDYPVSVLFQKTDSDVQVVPHQFDTTPDAMVFPLTDDRTYDAVAAAFDRVRRDGTYARLLRHWGLGEGSLS